MGMAEKSPVIDIAIAAELERFKIDYRPYSHPNFSTCEVSSTWHKAQNQPGQRVKNLFLRNKNGKQHFLLLLPHAIEFDKNIFKKLSDQKCGLASDDRLFKYLKLKPGCVSPLSLIHDETKHVQVYIEQSLINAACLHFHAGAPESSVILTPNALLLVLKHWGYQPHVVDWQVPNCDD
jgi:Ala-tRNA(Pro) deacylase